MISGSVGRCRCKVRARWTARPARSSSVRPVPSAAVWPSVYASCTTRQTSGNRASTVASSGRSSCGPAAISFFRARVSRAAMVGTLTRCAAAMAAVDTPQAQRRVSARPGPTDSAGVADGRPHPAGHRCRWVRVHGSAVPRSPPWSPRSIEICCERVSCCRKARVWSSHEARFGESRQVSSEEKTMQCYDCSARGIDRQAVAALHQLWCRTVRRVREIGRRRPSTAPNARKSKSSPDPGHALRFVRSGARDGEPSNRRSLNVWLPDQLTREWLTPATRPRSCGTSRRTRPWDW